METGKLVWLMKGSPIYERPNTAGGVTDSHFTGYVEEEAGRYAVEVHRSKEMGFEFQGQHDARLVAWSQVLLDGRLVWVRTRLLTEVHNAAG